MIECMDVSFSYPLNEMDSTKLSHGTLKNINLTISTGDFVLLCGASGCGKTTLTRLFNGLIPHYYDGTLNGTVKIDGENISQLSLFDISRKVGSVFQNPRSQFFNVDTTSEIAFGCENHGLPEPVILKRIDKVSAELNLSHLLGRSIFNLSGGEKQKIACGSASAVEPEIYVLDEPSSNLDAQSIRELREALKTLKASGKTVIIAEHRLHYVFDLADRIIYLKDGAICEDFSAAEFQLLSDAQKDKMGLRPINIRGLLQTTMASARQNGQVWKLRNFIFAYKHHPNILAIEQADIPMASVTALIGHNGAGKTSFMRCLCGLEKHCKGLAESAEGSYNTKQRMKLCYMVMQDVNHQLFTESVLDEIMLSQTEEDVNKAESILEDMDLLSYKECHPMALSGGQKQRVAIASAMASKRSIILFDEPTSGLDLFHMRQVADLLNRLADAGKTVVVVTHDPELILRCCDHVIHLEQGAVVESYSLKEASWRKHLLDFFVSE